MSPILSTFIVACCIVYMTDVLNVLNSMATEFVRLFINKNVEFVELKPKIFNCSLCQTFWIDLIILLIISPQNAYFAFIWAASTKYILLIFRLIDMSITKLVIYLESKLK